MLRGLPILLGILLAACATVGTTAPPPTLTPTETAVATLAPASIVTPTTTNETAPTARPSEATPVPLVKGWPTVRRAGVRMTGRLLDEPPPFEGAWMPGPAVSLRIRITGLAPGEAVSPGRGRRVRVPRPRLRGPAQPLHAGFGHDRSDSAALRAYLRRSRGRDGQDDQEDNGRRRRDGTGNDPVCRAGIGASVPCRSVLPVVRQQRGVEAPGQRPGTRSPARRTPASPDRSLTRGFLSSPRGGGTLAASRPVKT